MVKGKELVVAIAEAKKCNSQVWLIDRPNWVSAQRFDALRRHTEATDLSWRRCYVSERDEWMVGQLQARIALVQECGDPEEGKNSSSIVCVVSSDDEYARVSF